MPDTTTPNYALVLIQIGGSRDTWGDKMNANTQAIDLALKGIADSLATKLNIASFTDAAVMAKVQAVDGAGSGLDADTVDGLQASAFVLTSGLLNAIKAIDGAGTGLDADLLDGQEATAFAAANHNHDATYLAKAGGAVTGNITRGGAHLYYPAAGMTGGRMFLALATGADPTSQPGDIWLGY